MVAAGTAKNITEAVATVTRVHLNQVAGTYTIQAENAWIRDVTRVELATR